MKLFNVFYKDNDFDVCDLLGTFSSYELACDCILNNVSFRGITDEEDIDYVVAVDYSILSNELDKAETLELRE